MLKHNCRRLEGRVAIITGGAHGIGRAYAHRIAEEGAHVVIADLDASGAVELAEELSKENRRAIGVYCDISSGDSVDEMVATCVEEFDGVDVLINNASMFSVVPMSRVAFDEISREEWDRMMAVNIAGPWLCCKAVVPAMRARGYGKIVNVSSGTVFKGAATRVHYVASKAAVIGMTRTLARELGEDNITVNCIAPGGTLSEEDPSDDVLEARGRKVGDRALKRIQMPEDLVGAVAFLSSSDSDFVTGQTLVVDGGSVMN